MPEHRRSAPWRAASEIGHVEGCRPVTAAVAIADRREQARILRSRDRLSTTQQPAGRNTDSRARPDDAWREQRRVVGVGDRHPDVIPRPDPRRNVEILDVDDVLTGWRPKGDLARQVSDEWRGLDNAQRFVLVDLRRNPTGLRDRYLNVPQELGITLVGITNEDRVHVKITSRHRSLSSLDHVVDSQNFYAVCTTGSRYVVAESPFLARVTIGSLVGADR